MLTDTNLDIYSKQVIDRCRIDIRTCCYPGAPVPPSDVYNTSRTACWIAFNEHESEEEALEAAIKLFRKFVRQEYDERRFVNLSAGTGVTGKPHRKSAVDTYNHLPWGITVESGTVLISFTDNAQSIVDRVDSKKLLQEVLVYIAEKWGPHALVWCILPTIKDITTVQLLKQFNIDSFAALRFIQRFIKTVKEDVQNNFKGARV